MNVPMAFIFVYIVISGLVVYTVARPSNRKRVLECALAQIRKVSLCLEAVFRRKNT
jgi:hypothetical protein